MTGWGRSPVRLRSRQTGGDKSIEKIKEKRTGAKGLREKVKSAPKELVHRGLEDGTERLRLQFRDAAQRGQQDGDGGDQIEDTAAGGARQVERGGRDLLKSRRRDGKSQEPTDRSQSCTWDPDRSTSPQHERIPDSAQGRSTTLQAGQKAIKTKDAYMERQDPVAKMPVQRQENLAQKQGHALAVRRAEHGRQVRGSQQRRAIVSPQQGGGDSEKGPSTPAPWRSHSKDPRLGPAGIKERAGRGTPGKATAKGIKAAEHIPGEPMKTTQRAAQAAQKAAVHSTQKTAQATRMTARSAAVTAKSAARSVSAAAKGAVAAARSLAAAIAAGGWVVIVIVLVIFMAGMLIASPFGIFFADGSNAPDAISPSAAVAQINGELADRLADLQEDGPYDRVEVQGRPPAWADVLAVFAAKTAGAEDGVDVAVLDPQRVDLLRTVFWDMTKITTATETVEIPASGGIPASTEEVLTITITARTPDDMRVFYSFTAWQNEALDELLASSDLLTALAGDLTISGQDTKELLANLPTDLSPERRAVVETACRLVGKVNYFWGGKSLVLGWDDRWGTFRQVTAAGSSTTGTYRPYGMDCSGYVDWVFYNITGGGYVIGHGGGAHAQHTYCTPISWEEAMPGDLVFYPGDEHVGIVGGRDGNGNLLIIHCAYSANNVVITGAEGFTSIGRPVFYGE